MADTSKNPGNINSRNIPRRLESDAQIERLLDLAASQPLVYRVGVDDDLQRLGWIQTYDNMVGTVELADAAIDDNDHIILFNESGGVADEWKPDTEPMTIDGHEYTDADGADNPDEPMAELESAFDSATPADVAMADAGIVRDDNGLLRITFGMFTAIRKAESDNDHGANWMRIRKTTGETAANSYRDADACFCRFCGAKFADDDAVIQFTFWWTDGVCRITGYIHADITGCHKANKA